MVKDRLEGKISTELSFSAKLGFVSFLGGYPAFALISWDNWQGRRNEYQIVPYADIEFLTEMGRGCRKRKTTDAYKPESSFVRSTQKRRGKKKKNTDVETKENTDWEGKMAKINSLLDADDESKRKEGMDMIYKITDDLQEADGIHQAYKSIR